MSRIEPMADDSTPLAAEAGGDLQFRVVAIGGARKAFRLESVFWRSLEVLAKRSGRTLASEIQSRLGKAGAGSNQSSALRAGLADDLLQLWTASDDKNRRQDWSKLCAAMPTPAFLINNRSVLLAVNTPLVAALEKARVGPGPSIDSVEGAVNLTVQAPAGAIAELLGDIDKRFTVCNAAFSVGNYRIACRVRLAALNAGSVDSPVIMGFLEAALN